MQLENIFSFEKEKISSFYAMSELIKNNHMFNSLVKRYLSLDNDEKQHIFIKNKSAEINDAYVSKMNELTKDGKYKRIDEFRNQLLVNSNCQSDDSRDVLEMMFSIDTFYETEVYKKYEIFANFCKERGYQKVFDIGSAFGLQSEVFRNEGIVYVGINDGALDFWNKDIFKYITERYPIRIEASETDLAISSLCLTWNCYLYEGEKTLAEQCEALSRDFKACLLYMQMDKLNFVNRYFTNYEIIEDNMVYFYN